MMHPPPDFPPIPKCFSHLVNSTNSTDGEPRSPDYQYHQTNKGVDSQRVLSLSAFSGRSGGLNKIDSVEEIDSSDTDSTAVEASYTYQHHENFDESRAYEAHGLGSCTLENGQVMASKLAQQSIPNFRQCCNEPKSPFLKLNSSLLTLQEEMKDLRCLDISLFCQLLSLHDAIQDFKLSISDRYSETGSEYSLGTASYMGSMSSLNDDSDWGEDGMMINSCHDQPDGLNASVIGDEASQSASSLLKQITDLALRAEEDF